MQGLKPIFTVLLFAGLLTTFMLSCGSDNTGKDAKNNRILPYKTIELQSTTTTLYASYPAKLQGKMDIDIRSKIDGYIEKVHVEEGQEVKKGQVLFTINNPQFAQDVNNAKAAIASAEAAVAVAQMQVKKTQPLVDQGIISHYELEAARLELRAKEAALSQAKAMYNNSKINLAYTIIESPVDGIVGLLPYRVGSYVNSATAQPLTTVSDISTIYAYFSVPEKQQLAMADGLDTEASFQSKIKNIPAIDLILSNGELYPTKGTIESFSGQVNELTGAFNVRASFLNNNKLLRSGASATVRVPTAVNNALLIPQSATTELQNKRLAYIVGDSNKVKSVVIVVRPVPGGTYFVVDEGLSVKDKVIVEGIGILAEGTQIQPQIISLDSALAR